MIGHDDVATLVTSVGATIAYRTSGTGGAVLALHGAYSTHHEIRGFLEPMLPDRRIVYPDLPGMGDSTADGVTDAGTAVAALDELVAATIGDEPFAVVGHSFGAHLARGLAARRPRQVSGLALLCPMVPDDGRPEPRVVVEDDGAAGTLPEQVRDDYTGYFVVRTAATARRFRDAVVPALGRFDGDAVAAQLDRPAIPTDGPGDPYRGPVLVAVGRHDAWVGWRQLTGLLEAYPRASGLLVADAGHALPHERPELVAGALAACLTPTG